MSIASEEANFHTFAYYTNFMRFSVYSIIRTYTYMYMYTLQAVLQSHQAGQEAERLRAAMTALLHEAGQRTRKEVSQLISATFPTSLHTYMYVHTYTVPLMSVPSPHSYMYMYMYVRTCMYNYTCMYF